MSFGSKCTVLKKVLATLLRLFASPPMIRLHGNFLPRYASVLEAVNEIFGMFSRIQVRKLCYKIVLFAPLVLTLFSWLENGNVL